MKKVTSVDLDKLSTSEKKMIAAFRRRVGLGRPVGMVIMFNRGFLQYWDLVPIGVDREYGKNDKP